MRIFVKRILSLILTTCMLASSMLAIANANTPDQFKDFPDNWSTQAVTAALNNGLLHGYEDNTIRAEGMLTRAEMATVINNAFGAVIKADISAYKDVSPDSWYYDEIAKGVNMRTFVGGGDGYMYPDNAITREETFVVIARAFVLSGDNTASLDKFVDKDSISSWAVSSIAALAERGYVNGDELSRLNPKNNITRAEFAVLMDNIVKNYYSKEGTYTGTIDGTVLVNAGGVTFSNAVINGDLIIGDGVHIGDIRLENVTVNGRILARGPQKPGKIYIVKSTVKDGIVVNNVNGTVYFDNYKSDVFFNNLLSNTPVEFKKPSGSGGGGSSSSSSSTKYVVTFVDGKDYDGNPIEVKKYKVTEGKTLADMGYEMPSAKITYTQTGKSTNKYDHDVYQVGWFDENRTEYKADTIIDKDVTLHPGWKDLSITASTERFNIPEVAVSLNYEPDERVIDAATDLFFANRKAVLTGLTQYEDKVLEQPAAQRFITSDKQIKIVNLDMSFSDIFGSTENFKSIFKDQIDAALASVPKELRGQVEAKIDEALKQIAEEKIWYLNKNNMLDLNMPLSQVFGSEDNLRKMLKDATDGALSSVPDRFKEDIREELDNVIEFIVKSDATASLPQDKITEISDTITLSELFGGEEGFANTLKAEADSIIASNVPSDMQENVKTALYEVIDKLAKETKWDVNDPEANKVIPVSLKLNNLFGGNDEFAEMMKDELEEAIKDLEDEALKQEIMDQIGGVIDELAKKTVWSLEDEDGKTNVNIVKPVSYFMGGEQAMADRIKEEIGKKLEGLPEGIKAEVKAEVEAEVYPVVDELVKEGKTVWYVGDPDAIANISVDITLDDVFGGEGTFANKVKGAITAKLNKLPETYRSQVSADILGAVDNVLAIDEWTNNNPLGIANVSLKLTAKDIFSNQEGGFEKLINDKIDAALKEMPNSVKEAFKTKINPVVSTLVNSDVWDIEDAANTVEVEVKLTPADIFGGEDALKEFVTNEIDSKLAAFEDNGAAFDDPDVDIKAMVLELLASDTWNYNNSDNIITATAKVPVNTAFGGQDKIADKIRTAIAEHIANLSDANKDAINNAISNIAGQDKWSLNYQEGFADLTFEILLKDIIDDEIIDALTASAAGNLDKLSVINAIKNGESFDVTADNKDIVERLLDEIESKAFDSTINPELQAAVDFAGEEIVKTAFNNAKGAYVESLRDAINSIGSGASVNTIIEAQARLNINEIFLKELKEKLNDVNYNNIESSIADITAVVGSVESEFNIAKGNFINAIDSALLGAEIDSSFVLNLTLNLNKIFLEAMKDGINSKGYEDAIGTSLQKYVTEDKFNAAKASYLGDIDKALGEEHTQMVSALTIVTSLNVAELMIKELEKEVEKLNYNDLITSDIKADIEDIVGNGIENQFAAVKAEYLGRISNALNNGDELVNEITFAFDVDVNKLFLEGLYGEVEKTDYNAVKDNLNSLLGSELIVIVGEDNIKAAFTSAKEAYARNIQAAIDNSGNSVGNTINFALDIDVTKLLLEGLSEQVGNLEYDDISGYLPTELVDIIDDDDALRNSFDVAINGYKTAIAGALNGGKLSNKISVDVEVNVNKILIKQMNSKLPAITFDSIEGYIDDKIKEFIGRDKLEEAFEAAKAAYLDKVGAVLGGTSDSLDNNVKLDVEVNMIDLIIKGLDEKLGTIGYEDVADKIDDSIKEALGDEIENVVNDALDTYRERINAIKSGTATELDTSIVVNMQINITELVINGLIEKLTDLEYEDVRDIIDPSIVELLGEEYLLEQFETAKNNMLSVINEAVASKTPLTGDIFRLTLQLDVYELLLKEIDKRIATMDYDSISSKIPDEIKKVLGEDIIKKEYNKVVDDFAARVKYALDNDADTLDCSLRISINPIDDVLKPLYSRYIAEIVDRLGKYYTENQYLVEIKGIMTPDNLLVKEGNATDELSGYKLKSYDEYYDIMEKAVLLSDGAINTFSKAAVDSGNLEELVSVYVDLGYTYYAQVIDLVKKALTYTDYNIDIDSILPSDEAIEERRGSAEKYATALVKNPDLTIKEVIENGLSLVDVDVDWEEFEKTITKGQETITIKNRTYIPDLKNNK